MHTIVFHVNGDYKVIISFLERTLHFVRLNIAWLKSKSKEKSVMVREHVIVCGIGRQMYYQENKYR